MKKEVKLNQAIQIVGRSDNAHHTEFQLQFWKESVTANVMHSFLQLVQHHLNNGLSIKENIVNMETVINGVININQSYYQNEVLLKSVYTLDDCVAIIKDEFDKENFGSSYLDLGKDKKDIIGMWTYRVIKGLPCDINKDYSKETPSGILLLDNNIGIA